MEKVGSFEAKSVAHQGYEGHSKKEVGVLEMAMTAGSTGAM